MSEGRRASNAQRRRNTSSSGEDRSPFVLRSGPRRAFDYIRSRTTSSPARFAVVVFVTLILLFTALLSLPAATELGSSDSRSPTRCSPLSPRSASPG